MSTPTVGQALQTARVDGLAPRDAQALLGALLGRPRSWLIAHDDTVLSPDQAAQWADWVRRRATGEPVAYLTGWHEFHGLALQVGPAVLDPRPDTETLVDWALQDLQALQAAGCAQPRVLDLGTGSGAVALAIAHRCPAAQVSAVDLSPAALAVARTNGQRLGLAVDWHEGSWFAPLPGERFDLIVSNPPYIAEGDPHLPALRHEPQLALTSGADGLDAIRHIVIQAPAHLRPGGRLRLEHGHDQGEAVAALLRAGGWQAVQGRDDLAGHRRCTGAERSAAPAAGRVSADAV